MLYTSKGQIAIKKPVFEKIETQLQGGLAVNSNRLNLIEAEVVFSYDSNGIRLQPGSKVILKGTAGLSEWAKKTLIFKDKEFVLCPEGEVLGYEVVGYP